VNAPSIHRTPRTPALIVGRVSHLRTKPVRHGFTTRQYQWLVDLDELPDFGPLLRPLSRFDAGDHLDRGAADGSIKGDLVALLARHGFTCADDDRFLMLAHARVFGHVFDPLTIFWCIRRDDSLRAVVLEVHNTYGGRHSYVLDAADAGSTEIDKEFLVSPFNDDAGIYDVNLRTDDERIAVAIGLTREGERFFTASSGGRAVAATPRSLVRVASRQLLITQKVSLLIRLHGIRLWLAGLPLQQRNRRPRTEVQ
jgi:DUF1365 family protein